MNNLVRILFFGNIFYAICAVAMCIESNLLHGLSINHFPFYLLIFFCSWIYYTMIYVRSSVAKATSPINVWYRNNMHALKVLLWIVGVMVIAMAVYFFSIHYSAILKLTVWQWIFLASVPASGVFYTFNLPIPYFKKFRQVGWLKPFIIGYTWSGWVTLFPILTWQLQYGSGASPLFPQPLVWLQNFLFVSVLAIIFDVKDYAIDSRKKLKTIPAQVGIQPAYRFIILPLTVVTIGITIWMQLALAFTFAQIIIQLIPFALLLVEVTRKPRQRNVFYYLAYIDGLMLLKAITGIISVLYF